ncbi:MAG: rRNA methyltransferase [Clostridiales bacterium]|nr:rRNA methyltransferase [Clostridiales bacterium]
MDLPLSLRTAIEDSLSGEKPELLKKLSRQMTERYKNESGQGRVLVSQNLEARVYSAVRMPATYGAVCDALSYVQELIGTDGSNPVRTVFDIGAGSGAATWAAESVFSPQHITCLEREAAMRKVGADLMSEDPELQEKTEWSAFDLEKDALPGKADLVLSSYVLNELVPAARELAVRKFWEAADKLLVIVEPGTKEGFAVVREVRNQLLALGANLVAPCPHTDACRLDKDDWCHFSCRVARSRLHKQLKDADVPYEDEKYAYIAFSREPVARAEARVLRHPVISKGQVELSLCTRNANKTTVIRKRDGVAFKAAKKAKMGDALVLESSDTVD